MADELRTELQSAIWSYLAKEGDPVPSVEVKLDEADGTISGEIFLAFGFRTLRRAGLVELARLEFGGLLPVVEGRREKVLRVVKEAFAPAPAPVPPGP
jgi:hypothetical protein